MFFADSHPSGGFETLSTRVTFNILFKRVAACCQSVSNKPLATSFGCISPVISGFFVIFASSAPTFSYSCAMDSLTSLADSSVPASAYMLWDAFH